MHISISHTLVLLISLVAFLVPMTIGGATAETAPAESGYGREIEFAGRTWLAKTGFAGPGPNRFSEAADNVWVDANGWLHERITRRDGQWYCAEVVATESLGYGTYRFEVQGSVGDLDPNVVLGLFTWSDDPAYDHRELDIELARWGNPLAPNGQFTLQPNTASVRRVTFEHPLAAGPATFSLEWRSGHVTFQSTLGAADERVLGSPEHLVAPGPVVAEHTFSGAIPPPGGEHPRINLWLHDGRPRTDGAEAEVIIRRFEFIP